MIPSGSGSAVRSPGPAVRTTSLVGLPVTAGPGANTQQTTAAQHQVRWRLAPAANDSPVVFTHMTGGNDDD